MVDSDSHIVLQFRKPGLKPGLLRLKNTNLPCKNIAKLQTNLSKLKKIFLVLVCFNLSLSCSTITIFIELVSKSCQPCYTLLTLTKPKKPHNKVGKLITLNVGKAGNCTTYFDLLKNVKEKVKPETFVRKFS